VAGVSFVASLRRAWPVLVSYGVFAVWGVGCFVGSLALTSGGFGISPGAVGAVVGLIVATILGQVAGNLLGLAGLRLAVVASALTAAFVLAALSGLALGGFAVFLIVGVIAALGGYLGVASRLDVVAAWFPLSFAVGGAIVWMNHHNAIATFRGGSKHALWDPFTIVCLGGAVFLMLVFLATRQSLGLTAWQEAGRPAAATPEEAVLVARPGRGSLGVLFVFSIVVLGATALISPYLFRTRVDPDGKSGSGSQPKDGKGQDGKGQDGKSGKGKGKGSSGKGKGKGSSGGQGSSGGGQGKGGSGDGQGSGKGSSGSGKGSSGKGQGKGSSGGQGNGSAGDGQGSGKGSSGSGKGSSGKGQGKGSSGGQGDGSAGDGQGSGKGSSGSGKGSSGGQGKGSSGSGKGSSGSGKGSSGSGKGSSGDGQGSGKGKGDPLGEPDPSAAGEAGSEALAMGLRVMGYMLALALALLVLLLAVGPPIRRAFLLRHLEKPLWPVAPTARVMNLWRRALSALSMFDIEPAPGETPRDFARRAQSELGSAHGFEAPGLGEAASIVEKLDYAGRGLGPGEEQAMRDLVIALVKALGARVGTGKKLAAGWGAAPEVEP
jgi:uncharacterized membrane protein YgcG